MAARHVAPLLSIVLVSTSAVSMTDHGSGITDHGLWSQPEGATWTQQSAWRLSAEPILQIKGSDEKLEQAPLDPVRAFRLGDGRYGIGDGDQNGWDALLVYDRQGRFLGKWGRDGAGPGEFRQLFRWAGVYRSDSVAAYDFVDRALEIFSPTGKFARALKLPDKISPRAPPGTYGASDVFIGAFHDGSVLRFEPGVVNVPNAPGPAYYQPDLMVYDANGANPQKVGQFRTWGYWWDGKKAQQYHYHPMGYAVAGRDVLYYGFADDFAVRVLDKTGRELRVLRRPYTRERVTAADRDAIPTRSRGPRNEARFAEVKPAFSNIVEDDVGNVWIEHFRWLAPDEVAPNPKPSRWSVFDPQGRFLGEIQMPAAFLVSSITSDQVIGFYKDEFDVEHVRVYGLIKP
jgi:hypothetical protein